MGRSLIDEDLPPILSDSLRQKGHESLHLIDLGLRGLPDTEVFKVAQQRRATLLSRDLGFANTHQYLPGSDHGIVVVRFPSEMRRQALITELLARLAAVRDDELAGALIVVEPGRIRIRRPARASRAAARRSHHSRRDARATSLAAPHLL